MPKKSIDSVRLRKKINFNPFKYVQKKYFMGFKIKHLGAIRLRRPRFLRFLPFSVHFFSLSPVQISLKLFLRPNSGPLRPPLLWTSVMNSPLSHVFYHFPQNLFISERYQVNVSSSRSFSLFIHLKNLTTFNHSPE